MTINDNSTKSINAAIIDLQNQIKQLQHKIGILSKNQLKEDDIEFPGKVEYADEAGKAKEADHAKTADTAKYTSETENAVHAGYADIATKATQDGSGNVITDTYATKTELTSGLSGKADKSHTHTKSEITDFNHTHDDRYYTEVEIAAYLSSRARKWGSVYSGRYYTTGYFLLASLTGEKIGGNHDVGFVGSCLFDNCGFLSVHKFSAYVRGIASNVSHVKFTAQKTGGDSNGVDHLVATYESSNNAFTLRLYAKITRNWQRFNTCIDYASTGDVSKRLGVDNVSMPGTYSSSISGIKIACEEIGAPYAINDSKGNNIATSITSLEQRVAALESKV